MQVVISEDRNVEYSNNGGTIGENNAEILNITFPLGFEDYYKTIEFDTKDGKFVDRIENDTYKIENNITKYNSVRAQIVAKDLENNIVFKTEIFKIKFKNSINATEQLNSEKKILIDKLILDIQKVTDRVEALERDNTTNKANIKALQNNKVDKQDGKDLSTNDFTNEYKNKLDNLENYDDTEIKNEIESIKTKNTSQDEEINSLKDDNTQNKTDIQTNAENIQTNTQNIQTNAEHIQNNAENIASANIAIEALHEKNVSQDEALEQLRTEKDTQIADLQAENKALKSQIPTRTSKRRTHTLNR